MDNKSTLIKEVLLSLKQDNLESENSQKLLETLSKVIDDETLNNLIREVELSKETTLSIETFSLKLTCLPKLEFLVYIDDLHKKFDVSNLHELKDVIDAENFPELFLSKEPTLKEAGKLYDKFKALSQEDLQKIKDKLLEKLTDYKFFSMFDFFYVGGGMLINKHFEPLLNADINHFKETKDFFSYSLIATFKSYDNKLEKNIDRDEEYFILYNKNTKRYILYGLVDLIYVLLNKLDGKDRPPTDSSVYHLMPQLLFTHGVKELFHIYIILKNF